MTETRHKTVRETVKPPVVDTESTDASADQRFRTGLVGVMSELTRPTKARERRIAMYDQAYGGVSMFPTPRSRGSVRP